MKPIRTIFEKIALFTFVLFFAFVALYTPQIHTPKAVDAWRATETTQILNNIVLAAQRGIQQTSAIANTITSAMTGLLQKKEFVLDGLAWSLAKTTVSQMTSSIINWVNSGFQGSPAFVTNLQQTLTQASDRAFDSYLRQLDSPLSFVCDPFKLDVRIALAHYYENIRTSSAGGGGSGVSGRPAPTSCNLSGAVYDLESFIDGSRAFTDSVPSSIPGLNKTGWDTWLQVTTNPEKYTPQGSFLEAQAQADALTLEARNEQLAEINFGDGFLSAKVCEFVESPYGPNENCSITTPGKVINEALTFQTSAGTRSLIEADEFNEILGALFAELAQQAITGSAGLLGLSPGTGFTRPIGGTPFTDRLTAELMTTDPAVLRTNITSALATEQRYLNEANIFLTRLTDYSNDANNPPGPRNAAGAAALGISSLIPTINNNIANLNALAANINAAAGDPIAIQDIATRLSAIPTHNDSVVDGQINFWNSLLQQQTTGATGPVVGTINESTLRNSLTSARAIEQQLLNDANSFLPRLRTHAADPTQDATSRNNATTAADDIQNRLLPRISSNILELDNLISELNLANNNQTMLQNISNTFLSLPIHTSTEAGTLVDSWSRII